jgi:ectoine hydroxylase-related dioxygenase (phytanoyl-CoA dioxygenase family)
MRLDQVLQAGLRRLFPRPPDAVPPSAAAGLQAITQAQKDFFDDNGYLILPGFFPPDTVAALHARFDHLWEHRADLMDVPIDCLTLGQRLYFRAAPLQMRALPYKLLDLHLDDPTIRDVCAARALIDVLRDLLGATPLVCNTLTFERGSQQEAHFDTFFMPSKTRNMMAASWIAIDPVTGSNGPLYYYPKSHLLDPFVFSNGSIGAVFAELQTDAARHIERIIAEHDLRREIFLPQPGDVLIWHAQLLHGGSAIADPAATRRSIVTHYWTEVDYPDAAQRIDLGDGRWLLRKPHQLVIDETTYAEADAVLAGLDVAAELRAAVPAAFDPRSYLVRNPDLLRLKINPWVHYIDHGRGEGRTW